MAITHFTNKFIKLLLHSSYFLRRKSDMVKNPSPILKLTNICFILRIRFDPITFCLGDILLYNIRAMQYSLQGPYSCRRYKKVK